MNQLKKESVIFVDVSEPQQSYVTRSKSKLIFEDSSHNIYVPANVQQSKNSVLSDIYHA